MKYAQFQWSNPKMGRLGQKYLSFWPRSSKNRMLMSKISDLGRYFPKWGVHVKYPPFGRKIRKSGDLGAKYSILLKKFGNRVFRSKIPHFGRKIRKFGFQVKQNTNTSFTIYHWHQFCPKYIVFQNVMLDCRRSYLPILFKLQGTFFDML